MTNQMSRTLFHCALYNTIYSGLEIDHEAFLVALPHGRGSYLLKAHKPLNWVQQFLDSIEEAKNCTCNAHTSDKDLYFTANFGGNVS